jgi:hypothetical protein
LTLDRVLQISIAEESSKNTGSMLGSNSGGLNVARKSTYKKIQRGRGSIQNQDPAGMKVCQSCGNDGHKQGDWCPAKERNCFRCGALGHFASVCKRSSRAMALVEEGGEESGAEDLDDAGLVGLMMTSQTQGRPEGMIQVSTRCQGLPGKAVSFLPDTGADVTAIPLQVLESLGPGMRKRLRWDHTRITGAGGENLGPMGVVNATLVHNGWEHTTDLHVYARLKTPLLSKHACRAFNLIPEGFPYCQVEDAKSIAVSQMKEEAGKGHRHSLMQVAKPIEPLAPLQVGEKVKVQDRFTRKWDQAGTVVSKRNSGAYIVEMGSGWLCWVNRHSLRPDE